MIIPNRNLLHESALKTFLSATEAAGTTALRVRNTTGLTTSWAAQIGETGEEQSEVVIGTPTNVGTMGVSTTAFEHPADTPVYFIKYNQVVFEKSSSGTAGTASPITNGTLSYRPDAGVTQFDDTSGATTDAYKTYFRNSVLDVNSSESDWSVPSGPSFYSLAKLRSRIKSKLWNPNFIKDDETLDDWINEWREQMTNAIISMNENYAMGTVDIAFGTSGLGTITTADFKHFRRVWVTYNGADYFNSVKTDPNDFLPNQVFSSYHPYHTFHGDTVFEVLPKESGGTARVEFYRFGTTLVNDTDELALPFRSYTKSFVDYGLAQALFLDGKSKDHDRKLAEANLSKSMFISEMSSRDRSSTTMIDLVSPVSAEDGLL